MMKTILCLLMLFCIPCSNFQQVDNPLEEREQIQNYITFSYETILSEIDLKNHPKLVDTIIDDTFPQKNLPILAPDNDVRYNMPVLTPDTSMQNFILRKKIPEDFQLEKNYAPKYDGPIFLEVEEIPKFPDGEKTLKDYIAKYIKYPLEAYAKGIEGTVYVQFIINKSGEVREPKIQKGVIPALDKEAIRVIECLPNWEPGKQNGIEVNVLYILPIEFKL